MLLKRNLLFGDNIKLHHCNKASWITYLLIDKKYLPHCSPLLFKGATAYKNAQNVFHPPEQLLGSAILSKSFKHLARHVSASLMNFLTGAPRHRPAVWLLAKPTQHGSAYGLWPSDSLRLASSGSSWYTKERQKERERNNASVLSWVFQLFRWLPQKHLCSLIFQLLTPCKKIFSA